MQNSRVKIMQVDLANIVLSSSEDDPRMAIFMLNDMGREEAIKSAIEDGDDGLAETIRRIDDARNDEGQDAIELIDAIDQLRML